MNKTSRVILLIVVCLVALILYDKEMAPRTDTVKAVQTDPVILQEVLQLYGYPQLVIDALDPAVKEVIYENDVLFYGASLNYYSEEGERLLGLSVWGGDGALEEQLELPAYDVCIALVGGLCYVDGKVDHVMASMNYEWKHMPRDREADPCRITWQAANACLPDDGYIRSLSQTRKDGSVEWLQRENGAAMLWAAGYEWYADLRQVNRWDVQSILGAGIVQLEPMEGIHSIAIKGMYSYHRETRCFFDFDQDAEREKAIEFPVELEIQWSEGKEMAR